MHVKAKSIAMSGIMLALTMLFMLLGNVLEMNTLFFLAAASYFNGIIFREFGGRMSAAFYLAGVLLGFIVSPNKFHVISYAAMGLYILLTEVSWRLLEKWNLRKCSIEKCNPGNGTSGKRSPGKYDLGKRMRRVFWLIKYVLFNLMYIPAILLLQDILFAGKLTGKMLAVILLAGQAGLVVYDRAYEYVQGRIWTKYRRYFVSE